MAHEIKVRFPPSPTGEWHFGNVRTFVFNYLFAKKNQGEIVLRFEDTDSARNKPGADLSQIEILKTLGLDFDEGPYYQSQRKEIYKKELQRLLAEGKIYEAEENQAGTGKIIRIKNPERDVVWIDLIKGKTKISSTSFKDEKGNSDFIIARSIDDPLYHFTVVVDDFLMGITHVLRGEDHVTSTPRQIIILEALGSEIPLYGHFPTILGENKKKLGKRNGAVPVREYLEQGFLPEALLNAISLLGWNPGDEQEIFTKAELIEKFSLEKVQHHPAVFYGDKLDFINKEHLRKLPLEEVFLEILKRLPEKMQSNKLVKKILPLIFERISKWGDINTLLSNKEFDFFFEEPAYQKELLICDERMRKGVALDHEKVVEHLKEISKLLSDVSDFNYEKIKESVWEYASKEGRGIVLWAFRVSLSGKEKSPDPFLISEILGKEETLKRIDDATKL
ncbi:MAG: glutamyl-tRNA synthetase [Patescibacteria group bacterium]|jgi:glutamyl-tRNA synthetase|nr:glutamyl-tRNA synthetase [Patescibacteria group bacterium]